jgi:hypothetical protein
VRHGVANKRGGLAIRLTLFRWRLWFDRRRRRRAAAADQGWCGRVRSNYDEDRGGAGQRVAREASLGPRECAETVGWLVERAGSRAHRWLPRGGRRDTGSGEPAARAGQQASAGATGGPSGLRSSACLRRKAGGGGVHREAPMADSGGTVLARGEEVAAFIAVRKAVREFSLRAKGTKSWHGPWHGRSTARGRAATCGVYSGARLIGRRGAVQHHCDPWMRGSWRQGRGPEWRFHGAWTGGEKPAWACGPARSRRGGERRRCDGVRSGRQG